MKFHAGKKRRENILQHHLSSYQKIKPDQDNLQREKEDLRIHVVIMILKTDSRYLFLTTILNALAFLFDFRKGEWQIIETSTINVQFMNYEHTNLQYF